MTVESDVSLALRGLSFTVLLVHSSAMSLLLFKCYLNLLFPTTTSQQLILINNRYYENDSNFDDKDFDHIVFFMTRLLLFLIIYFFLHSGPTDSLSS